ncbi:MAG: aminotransferase class III-fold pyridoxal phosphate-dependent enzyme, partial [Clostridia bacterium]|nr:aminotransferase class III-fold pyridoxal phosphate-dependent enzyme [Clostridia bacterium]
IATNTFGYADDEWVAAVTAQLNSFSHTSNLYYTSPCARLAELLCERTGMSRVFFGNSGAEANEGAIKAARKYSFDKYGEGRNKIVTLVNSFHGRTITTLAATGQDVFHTTFMPFTEGFCHVPANDTAAMLSAMTPDVCAVMIELVQGEGGVNALDKDYVTAIAKACKERDILLIIDEVQTGNGRTGTLYAFEQFSVKPDILSTAKGLGGGLPIGAVMLGEKVKDTLSAGSHGSTFGGNPACAAGALNVISRLDDAFLAEVRKKSEYIFTRLESMKGVISVSGLGLMIGIKAEKPTAEIISEGLSRGVLFLSAKDKLRLLPPLNITYAQIDKALSVLAEILENS